MRLWSIHPRYLDTKGLVALWREGLLAQKVLAGETCGYRNHPQLTRFRDHPRPVSAIACYLYGIWQEAERRGYQFDRSRIRATKQSGIQLTVTRGQMQFERKHLLNKLEKRDRVKFNKLSSLQRISPHPLFRIISGKQEPWER